ncbi:hypothetical protein [Bradyrhizobium septentrionale]|uniref:Transmembrane protein n=1 Tax=Bradyrhizobium septentrionale TaxID=1404411 RepID=A0A973W7W2_9BRAD|nr:hypothetical protein [Bradyrhizobium septentrionale]UGY17872.1 hypothetical protein HAP48_0010795 [Bradyrhizobium septentrionale]UGY26609.1 hypothetical protein HU675_0007515 [Bradyrhizobium septentrionale]
MKRALAILFVGSAAAAAALSLLYNWLFPDILPLASTEPQAIWRFEAAFVVTAVSWTAAFVALASMLSLLLITFTNRDTTIR